MAKYIARFETDTIGAQPSGWTERWETADSTWTVEDDGSSPTDLLVRNVTTASGTRLLSFDAASGTADAQVLMRFRANDPPITQGFGIVIRGSGSAGSEDGYVLQWYKANGQIWLRPIGGSTFATGGASISSGVWYWMRFDVQGSTLRGKFWEDGNNEPDWSVWATDATHDGLSGSNWVGIYNGSTVDNMEVSVFSVGTNGDAADLPEDEVGMRDAQSLVYVPAVLDADARITQSFLQSVDALEDDIRVTQVAALALWGGLSDGIRLTQTAVLVLAHGNPCNTRWTQAWTITRVDGVVLRLTTLDVDLTWRGNTYLTCAGIASTASESMVELTESGNVEINAILNSSYVKDQELLAGWYDGATVEAWNIPWESQGDLPFRLFFGQIGSVNKGTVSFSADIVTQAAIAQQKNILDTYMPSCRHQLGDTLCTVDTGALTVSGTVTAITTPTTPGLSRKRVFVDSSRSEDEGYFNFGILTWTTGDNAGQSHQVDTFVGTTVTLWDACGYRIQVGDQYTLVPGCDKLSDTCKNKFSNFVNFGGFPHVPGKDELLGWRPKATEIR